MRPRHLVVTGLLLGCSLPGFAQNMASPAPRFYGGLSAYSSTFQPLGGSGGHTTVPFQATLGYQLRPRWAVQLGAAYSGYRQSYAYLGRYAEPGGINDYNFSYTGSYTVRLLSVALLGRYTLTRTPAHRLQVDALGGFTYEHSSVRDAGLYSSDQSGATLTNDYGSVVRQNNLLVGLGPGLRFRAANRLEIMLDVVLSAPLASDQSSGIVSATALGLRYRFGRS